jgi:enoyl-CoA hydratase/carnithine racemase
MSHSVIVSRDLGIPCVVSVTDATKSPRAAFELTLFGQIHDLAAATRLGIVQQTIATDKLQDAAVAWAALVHRMAIRLMHSRNAPYRQPSWQLSTMQLALIEIGYRAACRISQASMPMPDATRS